MTFRQRFLVAENAVILDQNMSHALGREREKKDIFHFSYAASEPACVACHQNLECDAGERIRKQAQMLQIQDWLQVSSFQA